jgi:hypothetical protein
MRGSFAPALRSKAAGLLAVLYAFAVLVPHAAIASGGQQALSHCLTEGQAANPEAGSMTGHRHAESAPHSHDNNRPGSDAQKRLAVVCCSLFAASAVVFDLRLVPPARVAVAEAPLFTEAGADGQGPGCIIRPPIA